MTSTRTVEASRLTSTLTGASLALSIVREATDAVPVVKQTLGAAMRILALAEKIDKDREALHALADRSLQLAQRVKDVMDGRAPDEKILASLQRINRAFDSIEAFMRKHTGRTLLLRAIGYVFIVPLHVERLSRELGDAVQELVLVALLDVNQKAHAMHELAEENARYVGEFRLLRHCDVEKLESVLSHGVRGSNLRVQYHRARVDGQLAVIRYFEEADSQNSRIVHSKDQADYEGVMSHDRIIMELSKVQRSHRNVARIYGWSRGSARERFTVFKAGYQPLESVLHSFPDPLITGIHWTVKVIDAVNYLQRLGISWLGHDPPYLLDDQLQPIIGLQNDMQRLKQNADLLFSSYSQLSYMTLPLWSCAEPQFVPGAKFQKLLEGSLDEPLAHLLYSVEGVDTERNTVPTVGFSDRRVLTDTAAELLLRIKENEAFDDGFRSESWMWANILLALDKHRSHPLTRSLFVVYIARRTEGDSIWLYGIDQDSERIVYDLYAFDVVDEAQDRVRRTFGITAPSEKKHSTLHVIATGTYCMPLE